MHCKRCNSKWKTIENIIYPNRCPFCGTYLEGDRLEAKETLLYIVKKYGSEVLSNRRLLSSYVSDLMINYPIERATLRMAINEGVGEYFVNIVKSTSTVSVHAQENKATKYLLEIGFTEERAKFVVECFEYARGKGNSDKIADFKDKDNAYTNLAIEYFRKKERDIAKELLLIAIKTGNVFAIEKYVDYFADDHKDISARTWYEWIKKILASNNNHKRALYEVGNALAYGIGTSADVKMAEKCFEKAGNESDALMEIVLRILVGKNNSRTIENAYYNLCSMANYKELATIVWKYINEYDNSFEENEVIDSLKKDNYIGDIYRGEIATYIGEYFLEKKDYRRCKFWYEIGIEYENQDSIYEYGTYLYTSKRIADQKKGIKILEKSENEEILHEIGQEYLYGRVCERSFDKAFRLFKESIRVTESKYEIAKMYFWGFGCKLDIKKSIYWFEKYINESNDPENKDNLERISKATTFLVQCYYEDLLKNENAESLEKLEDLAEYCKSRQAAIYLKRYYCATAQKRYKDKVKGAKYKELIEAIDSKKITKQYKSQKENINIFDANRELTFNINYLSAIYMSMEHLWLSDNYPNYLMNDFFNVALAMNKVDKNKYDHRIDIYLQNYMEGMLVRNDISFDKAKIQQAMRMYTESCWKSEKIADLEYGLKCYEFLQFYCSSEEIDDRILYYRAKLIAKYVEAETLYEHTSLIENLAKSGIEFAISFIGRIYFNEHNYIKSFYWFKKYIDKFEGNDCSIDNIFAYAETELFLGISYAWGLGTERNIEKAIKYMKNGIIHFRECSNIEQLTSFVRISRFFKLGVAIAEDMDESIEMPKDMVIAIVGLAKCVHYGSAEAMFELAEMFENGEYVEKNIEFAKKLYSAAANLGDENANEIITERSWFVPVSKFDICDIVKTALNTLKIKGVIFNRPISKCNCVSNCEEQCEKRELEFEELASNLEFSYNNY